MQRVEIARANGFHLVSIGNGLAYELGCNGERGSVFVQGDDAAEFRATWDGLETVFPNAHTGLLLREMWGMYGELARDPDTHKGDY
jgi:hypothetical protein